MTNQDERLNYFYLCVLRSHLSHKFRFIDHEPVMVCFTDDFIFIPCLDLENKFSTIDGD